MKERSRRHKNERRGGRHEHSRGGRALRVLAGVALVGAGGTTTSLALDAIGDAAEETRATRVENVEQMAAFDTVTLKGLAERTPSPTELRNQAARNGFKAVDKSEMTPSQQRSLEAVTPSTDCGVILPGANRVTLGAIGHEDASLVVGMRETGGGTVTKTDLETGDSTALDAFSEGFEGTEFNPGDGFNFNCVGTTENGDIRFTNILIGKQLEVPPAVLYLGNSEISLGEGTDNPTGLHGGQLGDVVSGRLTGNTDILGGLIDFSREYGIPTGDSSHVSIATSGDTALFDSEGNETVPIIENASQILSIENANGTVTFTSDYRIAGDPSSPQAPPIFSS